MYLLDTNVISELRKVHTGKADANVARWANGISASHMYISSISVLELERGSLSLERKDEQQGQLIRQWLEHQVLPAFDGRILTVDANVARRCASFHVPDPKPHMDALIAATAWVHGMTVVTRNTDDFIEMGVSLLNPWLT